MQRAIFSKAFVIFLGFIFLFSLAFLSSDSVVAQEEVCDSTHVRVIARNDVGKYLSDIGFEIYETVYDADRNPKPGKKVAGGTISEMLGYSDVSFVPAESEYTIKMWHLNNNVGAFWFFGDINLSCGEDFEITEYLSGFNFVLRNADGELRKDASISLYTQRYDVDGDPIKERQDLVKLLNTSTEGETTIYVADSSRYLSTEDGGAYVFVSPGKDGGEFIYYDLDLSDGSTEQFTYIFSDIAFYIEDDYGVPFPANTKIEIYEQDYDYDGEEMLGTKIKDILTDDKGFAFFEYPEGTYAVRIKNGSGDYQTFWDLEMIDQERNNVGLVVEGEWADGGGACEATSNLEIVTRNYDGDYVPNISFELYEQVSDIDGSPKVGNKAVGGKVNELGRGIVPFHPDPRKYYILKMYDKNANIGEFWFYDYIKFACGEDRSITKDLSSIKFVLRDADNNLKKNQAFSVYTQKFDIDGKPIHEKKDLLSSALNTGEEGFVRIYVAGPHPYDNEKKGKYIFSAQGTNRVEYIAYDLDVINQEDLNFDYVFSDIFFNLKDANGSPLENIDIEMYKQERSVSGNKILGTLVTKQKTNSEGMVKYEYPAGSYAVRFKDDVGQYFTYWDIRINDKQRAVKELKRNLVRITLRGASGNILPEGTSVNVYSMIADDDGQHFYRNKSIKTLKITAKGYVDISLIPDVYLFSFKEDKKEYGFAMETLNGTLHKIEIKKVSDREIKDDTSFRVIRSAGSASTDSSSLTEKLKGYILLQVENNGEAWYVDAESSKRYYMRDGGVAYQMMRDFGLGISNENLKKIPIGTNDRFEISDYDGDGLSDKIEEALGTDMYARDTDLDGYNDGEEVRGGYNPLGIGRMTEDLALANNLKGKILLQVESRGEAWYINPVDGKRYYMKDGEAAFNIMRFLSLGITNANLSTIEEGIINN
ncbi:MAG: hypothetical protein PF572_04155 [Patescibacteria group bacterium]|jgi:hypothetical protein|nr:hypothetical protein [Patescibacteria group bacterium]